MQMTEQEICKEYREAKDPNHQLTILAQLTTCKTEDIVEILTRNGETLRKRPYQRNAKPEEIAVSMKFLCVLLPVCHPSWIRIDMT